MSYVWAATHVGKRQRDPFSQSRGEKVGESTGCSASVLSGQRRVDQRDRRVHYARSDPRGESDAERGAAAAQRVICGTTCRNMGVKRGMADVAASDPRPHHEVAGATYGFYGSHRVERRRLSVQTDRRRQVATAAGFSGGYPRVAPGRGAQTCRRRPSSPPRARQSRQESAAFHGKRSRPGGSRIQAGQARQAAPGPDSGVVSTTTNSTCTQCRTWSQPNCATSAWRGCGFTPMISARSLASSSRSSNSWRTRASSTSGASRQ